MSTNRKIPLLQYWTRRYVLILFISLLIVGCLSSWWIQDSTKKNRLRVIEIYSQEMAAKIAPFMGDSTPTNVHKQILLEEKQFFEKKSISKNVSLHIRIVNSNGMLIFQKNPYSGSIPLSGAITEQHTEKWRDGKGNVWYEIATPIIWNEKSMGTMYLIIPNNSFTVKTDITNYAYMLVFLLTLGFAGWFVIYLLSKKLSRPIERMVVAAEQISTGNYNVKIDDTLVEKELYELNTSFKTMAERLQKLEELRTVLLAGVTHELKTPVTSISGCIQAVRDKVVIGEEADEFLDMSLAEVKRLQDMIYELLDFNSFASGVIQVNCKSLILQALLKQVVQQWKMSDENSTMSLKINAPFKDLRVKVDPNRTQQIILNLLNNAKEASGEKIEIQLNITEENEHFCAIRVTDYGIGIKEEEQKQIFERFYRGENKKFQKRGLGLGLSMSKMLAEAMGGKLYLEKSFPNIETTFVLLLPTPKAGKT